ncbi:hypothetical protein C5S31_02770 [ANME-1 cluster archaeon GoMg2]|nr:hypothetical protein [ANME-1 cluster archaeon GoMg2]
MSCGGRYYDRETVKILEVVKDSDDVPTTPDNTV